MPVVRRMTRPCWKCAEQVAEDEVGPRGCARCADCLACEGSGVGYVHEPQGWWHGSKVDAVEVPCCNCTGSGLEADDEGSCLDRGLDETEMCPRCVDEETDRRVALRYATREQVTTPVDDPWATSERPF